MGRRRYTRQMNHTGRVYIFNRSKGLALVLKITNYGVLSLFIRKANNFSSLFLDTFSPRYRPVNPDSPVINIVFLLGNVFYTLPLSRFKSASTIKLHSCSNVVSAVQPKSLAAFDGSPIRRSTSAGLKNLGLTRTISLPDAWSIATSSMPSPRHSITYIKRLAAKGNKISDGFCASCR